MKNTMAPAEMTPSEFDATAREMGFDPETMSETERDAIANVWADRQARQARRAAPPLLDPFPAPLDDPDDDPPADQLERARRRLRRRATAARASIADLIDTLQELADALADWEDLDG